MAKNKWAMVIMNHGYDPERDHARLDTKDVEAHILTVRDAEEAIILLFLNKNIGNLVVTKESGYFIRAVL